MKNKINSAILIAFLMMFTSISVVYISCTASAAQSTVTIDKTFTCSDGFSSGCFKTGCMAEKQLKMSNNQYTLAFAAPKTGDYKCTIKAVANYFNFPEGKAETNEVTDVKLNGVKVGSTKDEWCPPGGTTKPPTGCDLNLECCETRATPCDCNIFPEPSCSNECKLDDPSCPCAKPYLLCDDDPTNLKLMISMGKEMTMSLEKCKPGAVAFVREGGFKPRCQNWQFSTTTVKSKGGQDVRCPVSATITGGKLIATYDCSITRNYNIKLDFLTVGKSYTLGVWSSSTSAASWSTINACATGFAPYYAETKADKGDGLCIGGGPPPANCGNGVINPPEECDCQILGGEKICNMNGKTDCLSLNVGYVSGILKCTSTCTFDKSECKICGPGETLCVDKCCPVGSTCDIPTHTCSNEKLPN
ncbi:MAG: hypothetical protein V1648_05025 [Candidatus Aenigmatarchaeota archaeon]